MINLSCSPTMKGDGAIEALSRLVRGVILSLGRDCMFLDYEITSVNCLELNNFLPTDAAASIPLKYRGSSGFRRVER